MKVNYGGKGNGFRLTAENEYDEEFLFILAERTFKSSYVISRHPRKRFSEIFFDEVEEDVSPT